MLISAKASAFNLFGDEGETVLFAISGPLLSWQSEPSESLYVSFVVSVFVDKDGWHIIRMCKIFVAAPCNKNTKNASVYRKS